MPFTPPAPASRVLAVAICATVAGFCWPGVARSAAAQDLAAVLARPVSPGAIALLAGHAAEPAAQARLIEAVTHQNPAVRAVAARVAFVTLSKGAAAALGSAVAKEEHVHTGAEQVRALMALVGAPGDAVVISAVTRLGGRAALAMADALGRTRPDDLPRHLPMLVAATANFDLSELGASLATACVQHPAHAKAIVEAVLAVKSDDLWKAVLDPLHLTERRLAPAALVAGLTAAEESQRVRMLWHVFTLMDEGVQLPDDVIAAAAPRPIAVGATAADLTWDAFARELIARLRGAAATQADWAGLLARPAPKGFRELPSYAYGFLTEAEANGMDTGSGKRGEAIKVRDAALHGPRDTRRPGKPTQTTRTIPVFARGLLTDLMTVSNCRPPKSSAFMTRDMQLLFAAGEMTYEPDGRRRSHSIVQPSLSPECLAFVRGALALTIASIDHPALPELSDLVLVVFAPGFHSCADDSLAFGKPRAADLMFAGPLPESGPKVQYPEEFRGAGLPGFDVFLRAWVGRRGCISGVETLRGALPAFDFEAIEALLAAKMKPARLGGEPIDSSITYSVRFHLR